MKALLLLSSIIVGLTTLCCEGEESGWTRGSWSSGTSGGQVDQRMPTARQNQPYYPPPSFNKNPYQQRPYLPDDAEDLPYPFVPVRPQPQPGPTVQPMPYPPYPYPTVPTNPSVNPYPPQPLPNVTPYPSPLPPQLLPPATLPPVLPPTPVPALTATPPRPIGYLLVDTRKTLTGIQRRPLAYFQTVPRT